MRAERVDRPDIRALAGDGGSDHGGMHQGDVDQGGTDHDETGHDETGHDETGHDETGHDGTDQGERGVQLKLLAEQIAAAEHGTSGRNPVATGPAVVGTSDDGTSDDGTSRDGTSRDGTGQGGTVGGGRGAGGRGPGPRGRRRPLGQESTGGADVELSPTQQSAAAKAICLRLLTVAPRPRAGLAQALKRKEIPDDIAAAVLDRLAQVGLIDDVAYAHSFVRTKHRDRALGRSALRTELRRLGVDEDSMAGAVETVDSEVERARAQELISKRLDAAMAAGAITARRRLLGLLGRRGYPSDTAISVVDGAIAAYVGGGGVMQNRSTGLSGDGAVSGSA